MEIFMRSESNKQPIKSLLGDLSQSYSNQLNYKSSNFATK